MTDRLRQKISDHPALAVFLLALAVRLFCLASMTDFWSATLIKDSLAYHETALELAAGHGLVMEGKLTARIPPLYPLFLAGIYRATGCSRLAVMLIQAVLGSLLALYLFKLAMEALPRRATLLAGIISALYWPLILIGM